MFRHWLLSLALLLLASCSSITTPPGDVPASTSSQVPASLLTDLPGLESIDIQPSSKATTPPVTSTSNAAANGSAGPPKAVAPGTKSTSATTTAQPSQAELMRQAKENLKAWNPRASKK